MEQMQGGCNKIEPSEASGGADAASVVKMENNQPSSNVIASSGMAAKYAKFGGAKNCPIELVEDDVPVSGPVDDKKEDPIDENTEKNGEEIKVPAKQFGRGRWVFYGMLNSTANITPEAMETINQLQEFIFNNRDCDDAIMFYARFKRGLTISQKWFLEQMDALGIDVDPSSIQPPRTQTDYPLTKGRFAAGRRVDFHWCCKAARRVMERQAAEKKQAVEEESSGDERPTPTGKKMRVEASKEPPTKKGVRDFKDMTLGEIIRIIEKQDVVISNQRESIRRMTEGGSICQMTQGISDDTPKLAQLTADNSALEADNAELVAVNKKLKAELREVKRANEGFYEQNRKLKKKLTDAGKEMPP